MTASPNSEALALPGPDDDEIDNMAWSAFEEGMGFGMSVDSFKKPLRTLTKKFRAAIALDRSQRPQAGVEAVPDVSELLVWAVEDDLIRMSKIMDADLQDALVAYTKRILALSIPTQAAAVGASSAPVAWMFASITGSHVFYEGASRPEGAPNRAIPLYAGGAPVVEPVANHVPEELSKMVLYCHECGHIGEITPPAFACCPDRAQRLVHYETANQARAGFLQTISSAEISESSKQLPAGILHVEEPKGERFQTRRYEPIRMLPAGEYKLYLSAHATSSAVGAEGRWIPVTERVPEVGREGSGIDSVLVFAQPGQHADYASACMVANTQWAQSHAGRHYSHWMPLPAAPGAATPLPSEPLVAAASPDVAKMVDALTPTRAVYGREGVAFDAGFRDAIKAVLLVLATAT